MNPSKFVEMTKAHAELLKKGSDCEKANPSFFSEMGFLCRTNARSLELSAAKIGQEVFNNRMNDPDHQFFSQRKFDPIFFSHLAFTACAQSSRPLSTGVSGSGTGTIDFGGSLDCKSLEAAVRNRVDSFVKKEGSER